MADGRHFKNGSIAISQPCTDHPISWCADANFAFNNGHVTKKNQNFAKKSKWRTDPYWKSFSGNISAVYCPINEKFACTGCAKIK